MFPSLIRTEALKQFLPVLFSAFLFAPSAYPASFDFNARCQDAFREVMDLRFDKARLLLAEEQLEQPDNIMVDYVRSYIDFLVLFSGEDEAAFNVLKKNRTELFRRLETAPGNSPYYYFLQADVAIKWAFIRLKFREYSGAGLDFHKAKELLEKNNERYPDFLPNKLGLGILHALSGMIPQNYKWLAQLAGFEGSVEEGIFEINQVLSAKTGDLFLQSLQVTAGLSSALIQVNLRNDKTAALQVLRHFDNDPFMSSLSDSPVVTYAKVSVYTKTGRNDDAVRILDHCLTGRDIAPMFFLEYLYGIALMNKLDDKADDAFQRYIDHFKGSNYLKSALQKMAWSRLIQGDNLGYDACMKKITTTGALNVDEDKAAMEEAISKNKSPLPLLKARLLFDGGYYDKALDILLNEPLPGYIHTKRDLAEYYYRLGRIYDETGNVDGATRNYNLAIKTGRGLTQYFAGAAALHLGYLHERSGDMAAAEQNFRLCLSLDFTEYKTSLDQKAKAGLTRIRRYWKG